MSYATQPLILTLLGRGNHSCCYQTHDYLNLSFSKLIITFWIFDSFGDFRVTAPWHPPTSTFSSTEKSQMQFNTDFHMHYIWMPVKKGTYTVLWIQIPDFISLESTYVRIVECVRERECEITWAFTLSCFFKLLILCIVFTQLLLMATNQTLVQKNLFLTDHCVSGCKAVVESREGPHKFPVLSF